MDEGYFGERIAAVYDAHSAGMFAPEVLEPAVQTLAELTGEGAALEFAVGTGRLALPLAERGVRVVGIDNSAAMLDRLREKPGGERVEVLEGDMSATRVDGEFSLVYLVFNTIFNLVTQDGQVACFENAAAHLSSGGRFVIEARVPELQQLPLGQTVLPWRADPGGMSYYVYDVVTQRLSGQHYHFEDGRVEASPTEMRYAWPSELDLMARLAVARAITGAESGRLPEALSGRIAEAAARRTVPVLGITGTGGSGKSSLTDELVRRFRNDQQDKLRIAVIAVDPTRRKGGGALLGDRIRMNAIHDAAGDSAVFFRSLATRGSHELPEHLTDVIDVVKAAGLAERLLPGGAFVIQAFDPDPALLSRRSDVHTVSADNDHVRLAATIRDTLAQTITTTHTITTEGGTRLYPVRLRYAWPSELDLMARLAGLRPEGRWGGWARTPPTPGGTLVSVYRKPA